MSKGVGFSWRMAVRFCAPFEIAKRKGTMGSRGPNRSSLFSMGLGWLAGRSGHRPLYQIKSRGAQMSALLPRADMLCICINVR